MLNTLTDLSPKSNQSQNWQNTFTLIVPLHSTSVYYKEIPPVYHMYGNNFPVKEKGEEARCFQLTSDQQR